jgi:hypothetical protein
MGIATNQLFPEEMVLLSRGANAFLPTQQGAPVGWASAMVMRMMGMAGHEAISGFLHLTNYRLKFAAFGVGQSATSFSILLPSIASATASSRLLLRKVKLDFASGHSIQFGMWNVHLFLLVLEQERGRARFLDWDKVRKYIQSEPDKVGDFLVNA